MGYNRVSYQLNAECGIRGVMLQIVIIAALFVALRRWLLLTVALLRDWVLPPRNATAQKTSSCPRQHHKTSARLGS